MITQICGENNVRDASGALVPHRFQVRESTCAHSDPEAWARAVAELEREHPGHTLTYAGTQGPQRDDDHWVVHAWAVDFAPPVRTPSEYVEPNEVREARRRALAAFDPASVAKPQPAPFDHERAYGDRPAPRTWPEQDPPPEHTTLDPFPDMTIPGPVALLVKKAEASGWVVRVGYSRGYRRAQKIGTYDLIETLGVWAGPHPDSGWRFSAMYERKPDGPNKWTWGKTSVWRDGTFPFPYCNVTELKEWIGVRASVLPSWFAQVTKRVRDAERKAKASAKGRTSKAKEAA